MSLLSIEDVPDAGLAVWRFELHRFHRGPPKTQCLHVERARGPCAAAATSALGYGLPPIVFCSILEAVPCSANAYWSNISRLVFIRHASLCSCIAAVIA